MLQRILFASDESIFDEFLLSATVRSLLVFRRWRSGSYLTSLANGVEVADEAGLISVEIGCGEVAGELDFGLDRSGLALDSGVFAHEFDLRLDARKITLVFAEDAVAILEIFEAALEDREGSFLRALESG